MQDKITIADAPDCLNTNDKAMWVLGYQAALAARSTCLHQIQEPAPAQAAPAVAEKPDEAQIKALMRKHRIWIEHSTLFEDDEPPRELRAVQAEQHQFESFVRELIALAATPAADAPANVWQQVIDEELVSAHLGVANNNAMRDEAKWATHELICWHIDVATNPAVNGGKILAPVELLNRVLDSEAVEAMSDASDELRALLATATELPAQAVAASWKDHHTAQLVNQLRDCATTYGQTQQLRERIATIVAPLCAQLKAHPSVLQPTAPQRQAVERGEVLVTVSGFTGSGKSAIAGEIEIMCRALGLQVEWPDSDSEKHMTHADWIAALEQYKPRVRIVECNVPHSVVKGQDK